MLDWLEPPDALQVLRLMQEALSNVLKHAGASRVRLATADVRVMWRSASRMTARAFDIGSAPRGRGPRSQQRRAERLGGTLDLDSASGHRLCLCLRLPLHRKAPPQQQDDTLA